MDTSSYDVCARGDSIVNGCSLLLLPPPAQALAIAPSAYTPGLKGEGEDGSSLFEILLGNGSLAAVAEIPTV